MKKKKAPMRMCVACQTMRPKRELVRIVAGRDGEISLDSTGKAAGRGAYLCRDTACLAKAVKEKRLERALKSRIPAETAILLDRLITEGNDSG
ncbi:MAG: YlxR family protein [Clostridiaceae bacterium]|nr:YlxR family protein [Clostridiaceae bacterium]